MIKRAIERYKSPTPLKFKVWGKVILTIGTMMQIALQSIHVPVWVTISLALLTAIGAILPEFAILHQEPSAEGNIESDTI